MKNLITFILYCLSVTALLAQAKSESQLQILETSITETTLRLDVKSFDAVELLTPRGKAIVPTIQGGTPMLQKGAPDLPKYATALLIPNKGNMAVEVLEADFDEYFNVEIAPSKGNLLRTINPADVPFEYGEAYNQDQFFPGKLAALQTPFVFRQARGQALWLYPLQYNPATKTLRVYRSITVQVRQTGGNGKNELPGGPLQFESRAFDQLYRQLFANYQPPAANRGGTQQPDKMLVIAADALLEELQPLVTWRRQQGIHTTVVPVSEIGSPEAGDIFNFIKNYYTEHGISYLLLVGDENALKPQMRPSGGTPYSCDNCMGYMTGDDHLPEILVGRLHAATPEQLRIMVRRNLEYEKTPLVDAQANWMATGLAAASNEGLGIGDDGQADWQHGNEWKINHLANGFEQYWEFYDGSHGLDSPTPGDTTADKAGNPANPEIVSLLNTRGVSLYNYTGHGWEQGLVSGNFTNSAVGNLRNSGRYPILIAVACCAGNFTNGECLGEAWQRAGNTTSGQPWGGIAGFFSSDYQSWSPPMEGQDGMNQHLLDADGLALTPTIGTMLAYGNARMIAAYGQGGEVMADFWNPFAEPATMPRTALPLTLSATHADSTAFETTSLTVACPVEGALVSLFWENQTWAVATVENGLAKLDFQPLNNTGALTVTVSQFNYIPYQGSIFIKPASKPFVVGQVIQLDDSSGNNNQKADFGETVALQLLLKNIGIGAATAVSAEYSTLNPYVTLLNNLETPGEIQSGDSVQVSIPFKVHDKILNGTTAEFLLKLHYSDSLQYTTTIPVKLFAPALETGAWTLDDSAPKGNGNGRLDSGESAILTILNYNTGGSDLPEATGTLTAASPYIAIGPALTIGPLNAVSGTQPAQFTVTVSPGAPLSFMTEFGYTLSSPDGNYSTEKQIGPLVVNAIVEPFETGDFTSFKWEMGGNKPWVISTAGPYAGQYCARSGTITHNQRSTMEITLLVLEDGLVSFARRVSSEADFDFLRFYIDDAETGAWSGNLGWEEVSFPVAAGLHTLRWSYEKDGLVSDGTDRAWVDEIVLPPHQIVVSTTAGNSDKPELRVSPNPSDGLFQLQLNVPAEQVFSIKIYDGLGRLVETVQAPARSSAGAFSRQIDLRDREPGIYLVNLSGERGSQTVKVVVY